MSSEQPILSFSRCNLLVNLLQLTCGECLTISEGVAALLKEPFVLKSRVWRLTELRGTPVEGW